jgi:hypothetical protein
MLSPSPRHILALTPADRYTAQKPTSLFRSLHDRGGLSTAVCITEQRTNVPPIGSDPQWVAVVATASACISSTDTAARRSSMVPNEATYAVTDSSSGLGGRIARPLTSAGIRQTLLCRTHTRPRTATARHDRRPRRVRRP